MIVCHPQRESKNFPKVPAMLEPTLFMLPTPHTPLTLPMTQTPLTLTTTQTPLTLTMTQTLLTPQTLTYWKFWQMTILLLTQNKITPLRYNHQHHRPSSNSHRPHCQHILHYLMPTVWMPHPNWLSTAFHKVVQAHQFLGNIKGPWSITLVEWPLEPLSGPLSTPNVTGSSHIGQKCVGLRPRQCQIYWQYQRCAVTN